jgi:hypothetical protein
MISPAEEEKLSKQMVRNCGSKYEEPAPKGCELAG